jgi:transcriptional regulator with XRE-family HTH domain
MPPAPDKRQGRVARGLQAVIAEKQSPSGRPYTNAQIAAGTGLSEAAVAALRTGERPNPTINTISALAQFFGVPEERLMPPEALETEASEARALKQELAEVLADADVRNIALRSRGLSTGSIELIKAVVAKARELEGLDGPAGRQQPDADLPHSAS